MQTAGKGHSKPRFLLISSLAAREPHLSPYAASKKQGEKALAKEASGMQWAALRPPPVYGPGDKEMRPLFQWIYRGIAPVIESANARFSMLYIEDLADAIVRWLACENAQQQHFELHDGQQNGYSWEDLIREISLLSGRHVYRVPVPLLPLKWIARLNVHLSGPAGYAPMLTPGKVCELMHADWTCDNTLFSRETGWRPKILLEEGLRRTLKPDIKIQEYSNG